MKLLYIIPFLLLCIFSESLLAQSGCTTNWCDHKLWLVGLLIFTSMALITFIVLRFCNKEFLKDALAEKNIPISINAVNTPIKPRSASRLILFLSGLTTILICIAVLPYWFYTSIASGQEVLNLNQLVNFLLPLGIGVIPYTVNQFNAPAKQTGATPPTTPKQDKT